jgi:uncharacterized protein YqeY
VNIKEQLRDELKSAMRERDRNRIDVIRQVNSEIERIATAPGFSDEINDDLYVATIGAYAKKMGKALTEFEGYGDRAAEAAEKLRFEVEYLSQWLPKGLSEDELGVIVDATIEELGVTEPSAIGQVMGAIMKQHDGLDGTVVNKLVRARLAG